jgi:C1A family cysteine protease
MNKSLLRILANPKRVRQVQEKIERIYNLNINRLDKCELKLKVRKPMKLPKKVDLRSRFQPILNQGNLGSCTANALVSIVGYDDKTLFGSRLFLYYNERELINTIHHDSGAYLSDGIKTLQTYGICQEKSWPYVISKFTEKPPDSCYEEALNHNALVVENINNTLVDMKSSLASNEPFVVGILVFSSFETPYVARTGKVPMPSKNDVLLGGHAVVCVGYDDSKKVWIMRNSWGRAWGDKGYFYLPYAYLTNSNLSSDLWIIKQMEMPTTKKLN